MSAAIGYREGGIEGVEIEGTEFKGESKNAGEWLWGCGESEGACIGLTELFLVEAGDTVWSGPLERSCCEAAAAAASCRRRR